MAALETPSLVRTSTDTLVAALGHLHDGIGQLVGAGATAGVIPVADVNLGLDYALAAAEIAEVLDARLARA
jgi:hypothetical protein